MNRFLLNLIYLVFFSMTPYHLAIAAVTPWLPLSVENGHISVPVTIAGIEGKAILDTGSQLNALNSAFKNKHQLEFSKGKKYLVTGVHGEEKIDSFNKVPTDLFGSDMELNGLADVFLGPPSTALLLGAGFLEQFVMQIDYPNKRIRFITHGSLKMSELQNIDFQLQKGTAMPIVKIGLGSKQSAWVLFDTGNSGGVLLNRSKIEALQLGENVKQEQTASIGVTSHIAVLDNYRIPELQFGPYTLEHVLVSVPADERKINLPEQHRELGSNIRGKRVDGILGFDVLQHFVLTIDYKNGYAHVGLPEEI